MHKKWHLCLYGTAAPYQIYIRPRMMMMVMKTSDISETKQSRAKLNTDTEAVGDRSGDQLQLAPT